MDGFQALGGLGVLGGAVFDVLGLVKHNCGEVQGGQQFDIPAQQRVGGHDNIGLAKIIPLRVPFAAAHHEDAEPRRPAR